MKFLAALVIGGMVGVKFEHDGNPNAALAAGLTFVFIYLILAL